MSTKSSSEGAPAEGPEPLRRSREAVKAASLAAAYELLTEVGLSGVSFDEVSRRSGVAKTTIYRYWPTRSALLFDAVMQFAPRLQTPATGSLRGDLTALALGLAHVRVHRRLVSGFFGSPLDHPVHDRGWRARRCRFCAVRARRAMPGERSCSKPGSR